MKDKIIAYIGMLIFMLTTMAGPIVYNWYKATFHISDGQMFGPILTGMIIWIVALILTIRRVITAFNIKA